MWICEGETNIKLSGKKSDYNDYRMHNDLRIYVEVEKDGLAKQRERLPHSIGFAKEDSVKINGDFFLYPENGIESIEKSLSKVFLDKESIINAVDYSVKKNSLELFGITAEGIADAILLAKGASDGK